jgi:hypothetical protein
VVRAIRALRVTIAATAAAGVLIATGRVTTIDLVQVSRDLGDQIAKYGISVLPSAVVLIAMGLLADLLLDLRRKRRLADTEAQKLQAHKATMRTVLHIVNNFLNSLLLFELEVEPLVGRESCEALDRLVQQTHDKLKALGDLEAVHEIWLPTGVGIAFPEPPPAPEVNVAKTPTTSPQ